MDATTKSSMVTATKVAPVDSRLTNIHGSASDCLKLFRRSSAKAASRYVLPAFGPPYRFLSRVLTLPTCFMLPLNQAKLLDVDFLSSYHRKFSRGDTPLRCRGDQGATEILS